MLCPNIWSIVIPYARIRRLVSTMDSVLQVTRKEQPMKKILALIACFWGMALSSNMGFASPADIMTALKEARGKLVALTGTTGKGTQAALVEEIKAATQDVNAKLEATLSDPSTTADVKDKLNEFKSIWVEF